MKYLYLLLFASLLLSSSCKEDKKDRIAHLVTEWQGKEIVFPQDMVFTRYAKDTVEQAISNTSYKILVYVDSIGCTSCKLQLPRWKELIAYTDSMSNQQVSYLFFFHAKDYKEICYLLKRDGFDYPVCLDNKDQLNKLNQFPADITFQTFLLDSDNKVIAIGNPIHNLAVKDLYLEQIQGQLNEHLIVCTQLITDSLEYDLGLVSAGEIKEQTISLQNTGNYNFYIKGITTSCECTETFYDWKEIPQRESKTVTVRYKGEQLGDFLRTITIYGNIPEKSITLTFVGIVK